MADIAALYVHIPFCHSICPFCAFAVHQHRADLRRGYLEALGVEMERVARVYSAGARIESIYFGGGTPSTLAEGEVRELMDRLRTNFEVVPGVEIAFELNPEDATGEYLAGLQAAGITRISLGTQSLDAATLQSLGRTHTTEQAVAALDATAASALANFNADVMFGAPSIDPETFRGDVEALAARRVPHLSLYGLDVEDNTPFGRDAKVQAWAEEHREVQAEQYLWAHETLTNAGYRHYEVSNFCLPGYEGRQNLLVWSGRGYLGLGQGAHSFADGERWHNARHLGAYQREIEKGRPPVAFRERLTPEQAANERLMLALRQDTGLDIPEWERLHRQRWDERRRRIAEALAAAGRAHFDGKTLRLTAAGMLLADEITGQLMVE